MDVYFIFLLPSIAVTHQQLHCMGYQSPVDRILRIRGDVRGSVTATPVHGRESTVAIYRRFLEQTPENTQGLLHVLKQNFSTAEET